MRFAAEWFQRRIFALFRVIPWIIVIRMNEIIFEVTQDADGGLVAECLTESIFTQANTWDELRRNVKEAVEAYFFDKPQPTAIRLHLMRDEVVLA